MEVVDKEFGDNLMVRSTSSISSYKSVYSAEPLEVGDRYFFEVKFLKGCNFKLGIYIDDGCQKKPLDTAFCDYL